MTILPSSYEVTCISCLVEGDTYIYNNEGYIVLDKKFDYIEVWNLHKNKKQQMTYTFEYIVTRVKGGIISI